MPQLQSGPFPSGPSVSTRTLASLSYNPPPYTKSFKGGQMPLYLQQVAYSPEGWEALVNKPQDRIEAVRPAIEKLGGKIVNAWFAFGEYDVVVVVDMPNNVGAAAIAMAFAS